MAQPPTAVCCMAHAVADENRLYIQGGLSADALGRKEVNQFVALDLTVTSWPASRPPWVWPENPGNAAILTASYHSMTVEKGLESLFIWQPFQANPWWTYNSNTKYWSNYTIALPVTKVNGIRNCVDKDSGNVYISSGSTNGQEMIMNTPGQPTLTLSAMPSPVIFQSWVWSTQRKTLLQYGGRSLDGNTANAVLSEYSAANGWQVVPTKGSSPGDLSAYAGKKMIVFGGHSIDGVAKAGIYIFDTATAEWAVGKAADPAQARTNMACAVSGDSFIAWGGESGQTIMDATPIIYDMRNNQWTTQFNRVIAPTATSGTAPTATSSSPLPTPSSASPGSTSNAAAIGGGVAGALVVASLIGFFLYRRHKRTRQTPHEQDDSNTERSRQQPPNTTSEFKGQLPPRPPIYHQHAASPPTSHYPGPQAILPGPQGQQGLATAVTNGEYRYSQDAVQQPLLPLQQFQQSNVYNDKDNLYRGGLTPRGPQLQTNSATPQVQGLTQEESLYTDKNQYLDRSRELARMMENIRAEQEELEESRLQHEALMQNYQRRDEPGILTSLPCLEAFGRNAHAVRKLTIDWTQVLVYHDCVTASEEQQLGKLFRKADRGTEPLLPMTNLRELILTYEPLDDDRSYRQTDSKDSHVTMEALCWLINLNPHLKHLDMGTDSIMELPDCESLARAISELSELTVLDATLHNRDSWTPFGLDLFLTCQPSIRTFRVRSLWDHYPSDSDWYPSPPEAGEEEVGGETKSLKPLENLKNLELWHIGEDEATIEDILAIFSRCPNIQKLDIPSIPEQFNGDMIGEFIGKKCPMIRVLTCGGGHIDNGVCGDVAMGIIESLPAQQLEEFEFWGSFWSSSTMFISIRPILQHSTTLRKCWLSETSPIVNTSIAAILEECVNLAELVLDCDHFWDSWVGLYVTLSDLLDRQWNSTKLIRLSLGVRGCEIPNHPEKCGYETRPIPILLSNIEREHFDRIDELYRRIGTLKELERLDLNPAAVDPYSLKEDRHFARLATMGVETGLPDFWRHLTGLKKLRKFCGPFRSSIDV
ncbi:hypothetical protein EC991_007107 [Linnemannia zychae]|nr:hypothetical protein EC991_007107 [Linnemannia zychae]